MIKNIIKEFFPLIEKSTPDWLNTIIKKDNITLESYLWYSDFCNRIRVCKLTIKDKLKAETLVIYPREYYETPIFGTEYLEISDKKYFGAIDFHPVSENKEYLSYMEMFPDIKQNKSKIYDLEKYFSEKFWIRKDNKDFYNEYQIMLKCYLHQYKKCLYNSQLKSVSYLNKHQKYNEHMSLYDPAYGILKNYFPEEFVKKYIQGFLFLD